MAGDRTDPQHHSPPPSCGAQGAGGGPAAFAVSVGSVSEPLCLLRSRGYIFHSGDELIMLRDSNRTVY